MRRDAIAAVAVVVLLLALEAGTGGAKAYPLGGPSGFLPSRTSEQSVAGSVAVGWHPILRGPGLPDGLLTDQQRDRILFGVHERLLVMDRDGAVLANLSAPFGVPFGVDAATGYVYYVLAEWWSGKATVLAVDPMNGTTVRGPWSYEMGDRLEWFTIGNGVFYMVSVQFLPADPSGVVPLKSTPIVASSLTGQILQN